MGSISAICLALSATITTATLPAIPIAATLVLNLILFILKRALKSASLYLILIVTLILILILIRPLVSSKKRPQQQQQQQQQQLLLPLPLFLLLLILLLPLDCLTAAKRETQWPLDVRPQHQIFLAASQVTHSNHEPLKLHRLPTNFTGKWMTSFISGAKSDLADGKSFLTLKRSILREKNGENSRLTLRSFLVDKLLHLTRSQAKKEKAGKGNLKSRLLVARLARKTNWNALFIQLAKVLIQYYLDLILNDMFGQTVGSSRQSRSSTPGDLRNSFRDFLKSTSNLPLQTT